jgi:hypothetical protein
VTRDRDKTGDGGAVVATALVQSLIIRIEDAAALASVAPALAGLVERAVVRILDLAILDKGVDGSVAVLELADLEEAAWLPDVHALLPHRRHTRPRSDDHLRRGFELPLTATKFATGLLDRSDPDLPSAHRVREPPRQRE